MKMPLPLRLFFLFFSLGACSLSLESKIKKIEQENVQKPKRTLIQLDQLYEGLSDKKDKLRVLKSIEKLIRKEIRDPHLLFQVFKKKAFFTSSKKEKNEAYLKMAQLSVQNLKDNIMAQDFLFKIDEKELSKEQRDQFYQLKILSFIHAGQMDQASIEIEDLLKRKDLSPTERFKVSMLKTKILVAHEKESELEKTLIGLLKSHPNLSSKWRLRSQLALLYEDQEQYAKALEQLTKMKEEEVGDEGDELLSVRIKQLKERFKQQPGAKGRYKR